MTKLNDLLEKGFVLATGSSLAIAKADILYAAEESVCFDIGNISNIEFGIRPINSLIRLPFPTCFFSYILTDESGRNPLSCGVLALDGGDTIGLFFFFLHNDWNYFGKAIIYLKEDCLVRMDDEKLSTEVIWITKFLSAMNCSNVVKVEHKPDENLQKARTKRGKKPLFSYWTLNLSIPNEREEGASLGGTHASPRVHLRRGHARQYAPGKYTWVQPCAVGNKSLGVIHKDYAVKQGPH